MKQSETDLQIQVAEYLSAQFPHLLWFHPANERKCSPQYGARLKRMGVKPGVPDILMFWNGGKGAIELKVGKNKATPFQEYFADRWQWTGGEYALCRSLDDVISVTDLWLK